MTLKTGDDASPWLTVWFQPTRTISRMIAENSFPHVRLLAILQMAAALTSALASSEYSHLLKDWRVILGVGIGSALLGMPFLGLISYLFRVIGASLGGHAKADWICAAYAWSSLPLFVEGCIATAGVLCGLKLERDYGYNTTTAINVIEYGLTLWALILFWKMLRLALGLSFWRTTATMVYGYIATFLLLLLICIVVAAMAIPIVIATRT